MLPEDVSSLPIHKTVLTNVVTCGKFKKKVSKQDLECVKINACDTNTNTNTSGDRTPVGRPLASISAKSSQPSKRGRLRDSVHELAVPEC